MESVSVIIPNYNQGAFLTQALASVLAQSAVPQEILIVDDASTDDSVARVEAFLAAHAPATPVRLVRRPVRGGVGAARNVGARQATGSLLAFLDADDLWEPEKLRRQLALLAERPDVGVTFTKASVFADDATMECLRGADSRAVSPSHWTRSFNALFQHPRPDSTWEFLRRNLRYSFVCWSSVVVRRSVYLRTGGFAEDLSVQAEDGLFLLQAIFVAGVAGVPESLTRYRLHPESFTLRVYNRPSAYTDAAGEQTARTVRARLARFVLAQAMTGRATGRAVRFVAHLVRHRIEERFVSRARRFLAHPALREKLDIVILFVTSACNLRCAMCFYADNLNTKNDLPPDRLKQVIRTLPPTRFLLMTGGEPFANPDIVDVVLAALERSPVGVNTNGTYARRTLEGVRKILERSSSGHALILTVSLDGFEATHNAVRGANAYATSLQTLRDLITLKDDFARLSVAVTTTITSQNFAEVPAFGRFIAEEVGPDYHNFEIERSNPGSAEGASIDRGALKSVYDELLLLIRRFYPASYEELRLQYAIQFNNKVDGARWPYECTAGQTSLVIYEDGRFSSCEMLPDVGNLQTLAYNGTAALDSPAMKSRVRDIARQRCDCQHGCWIVSSRNTQIRRGRYGTDHSAYDPSFGASARQA